MRKWKKWVAGMMSFALISSMGERFVHKRDVGSTGR